MRFLCDEMLLRLARLLRAAGYDALLARDGQRDAELLAIARAENRVLVTRDKRLAAEAHPRAVLVEGRGAYAEAESLSAALPIDWRLAPSAAASSTTSRCDTPTRRTSAAFPARPARGPAPSAPAPRAAASTGRAATCAG